jgi:multidrug transporter EmrE-like cation transporter
MSTKTILIFATMVVAGTIGDCLVSKGMKEVGEITFGHPADLARGGARALRNPFFVLGVAVQALYFATFSAALSWTDVSVVVPIGAVSFLLTAFVAQHALGEQVTPQRWVGTLLIVAGIVLVARSHPSRPLARSPHLPVREIGRRAPELLAAPSRQGHSREAGAGHGS